MLQNSLPRMWFRCHCAMSGNTPTSWNRLSHLRKENLITERKGCVVMLVFHPSHVVMVS